MSIPMQLTIRSAGAIAEGKTALLAAAWFGNLGKSGVTLSSGRLGGSEAAVCCYNASAADTRLR